MGQGGTEGSGSSQHAPKPQRAALPCLCPQVGVAVGLDTQPQPGTFVPWSRGLTGQGGPLTPTPLIALWWGQIGARVQPCLRPACTPSCFVGLGPVQGRNSRVGPAGAGAAGHIFGTTWPTEDQRGLSGDIPPRPCPDPPAGSTAPGSPRTAEGCQHHTVCRTGGLAAGRTIPPLRVPAPQSNTS